MVIIVSVLLTVAILVVGYSLFMINPFKRPFLTESDYTHHTPPWWHLYYSSKYFFHVKRARRGEEVEHIFKKDMSANPERAELIDRQTITIHATGDLMYRRELATPGGKDLWKYIGKDFFSADLCIGNLEFAINPNWVIEKLLRYSVPPEWSGLLLGDPQFGNFHAVSLANNHINDSLKEGIISTCNYLDSIGILHSGAHRTADEQDIFPIIERKGIKIAFLSYTFSTNNIPLDHGFEFGTNCIRFNALNDKDYDPSLIYKHITLAKKRGADIIISSHHWGVEFEYYPPIRLIKRAHELLEAGIDCIIGHHPHVINPVERYTTRDGRECVVFYSLGNLTSYALLTNMQRLSSIAQITIETGINQSRNITVKIGDITLRPVYHLIEHTNNSTQLRLIPLYDAAHSIENGENSFDLRPGVRHRILKVYHEHCRYFHQKGINFK